MCCALVDVGTVLLELRRVGGVGVGLLGQTVVAVVVAVVAG